MKITVTKDEVLAWMAADPAQRGSAQAAAHFGIKGHTVRSWVARARRRAGVAAPPPPPATGATGTLHVLPPVAPSPPPPIVITREADEKPLPVDLHDLAVDVLRATLAAMRRSVRRAKPSEQAQILAAVGDRLPVLGDARKRGDTPATADPGTPEWLAEQADLAASLPPHVLQAALRRQGAG